MIAASTGQSISQAGDARFSLSGVHPARVAATICGRMDAYGWTPVPVADAEGALRLIFRKGPQTAAYEISFARGVTEVRMAVGSPAAVEGAEGDLSAPAGGPGS